MNKLNPVKPSTLLLPMDDIAKELKETYGLVTKDEDAPDTKKVGNINSDLIAVAATDPATGKLLQDRETVQNALHLGGKPFDQYFTKDEGSNIAIFGEGINSIMAQEFLKLRDELYQLKGELAQQGFINDYALYEGFLDAFKNNDIKYINSVFDTRNKTVDNSSNIKEISGIIHSVENNNVDTCQLSNFDSINVGDYIIIKQDKSAIDNTDPSYNSIKNFTEIVKVTEKDVVGNIKFTPAVPSSIHYKCTRIYKTLGEYINNTFSFSTVVDKSITNNEKYIILNDDLYAKPYGITKSKTGYAVGLYIPTEADGALSKIVIKGRAVGNPGALRCYIVDKKNLEYIKSYDQARSAGFILDTANPVMSNTATVTKNIEFKFNEKLHLISNSNQQYVFIIEATAASDIDKWELYMIWHTSTQNGPEEDLEKNIVLYEFDEIDDFDKDKTQRAIKLTDAVKNLDLYFKLVTKEILTYAEEPFNKGLYTSNFSLPNPIDVNKIRLTMRINREGMLEVDTNDSLYAGGTSIYAKISEDTSYIPSYEGVRKYDLSLRTGIKDTDQVIIGTTIKKFKKIESTLMQLEDGMGMYIKHNDPIYRVGYTVQVRAWRENPITKEIEKDDAGNPVVQLIEMPLIAVMPDRNKPRTDASDRLVFEGETKKLKNGKPMYANKFELQVKWNSNFEADDLKKYYELRGRIHNLTLTLDKSL